MPVAPTPISPGRAVPAKTGFTRETHTHPSDERKFAEGVTERPCPYSARLRAFPVIDVEVLALLDRIRNTGTPHHRMPVDIEILKAVMGVHQASGEGQWLFGVFLAHANDSIELDSLQGEGVPRKPNSNSRAVFVQQAVRRPRFQAQNQRENASGLVPIPVASGQASVACQPITGNIFHAERTT